MSKKLLPLLLLLVGCPDPAATTDPNAVPGQGPQGGPPPTSPGQPDPSAVPNPDGTAPPAAGGAAGATPGARPAAPGFQVTAGQGVKISGTAVYAGSAKGKLRIDFLRNPEGAPFPELIHSIELEKPGEWSVEAPQDIGELSVVAFLDADDNGPSPGEPMALYKSPLKIEKTEVKGVVLELSDNPDMGAFKPKGAPPDGSAVINGPPPDGSAPGAVPPGGAPPGGAPPAGAPGAPPAGAPPAGAAPAGAPPAGAAPAAPAAGGK